MDLEERFKQELDELEESLQMPYVTSVERIAKAEGGATVLLKHLSKRWGRLPEEVQQQIQRLRIEELADLGEAMLDFRSLQDLQTWLAAQSVTSDR